MSLKFTAPLSSCDSRTSFLLRLSFTLDVARLVIYHAFYKHRAALLADALVFADYKFSAFAFGTLHAHSTFYFAFFTVVASHLLSGLSAFFMSPPVLSYSSNQANIGFSSRNNFSSIGIFATFVTDISQRIYPSQKAPIWLIDEKSHGKCFRICRCSFASSFLLHRHMDRRPSFPFHHKVTAFSQIGNIALSRPQ